MKILFAVFIGGGLGSLARFAVSKYALRFIESDFPWGTFFSNMLACAILALSVYYFRHLLTSDSVWSFFIITGFCGGFSTFSTFSFENYVLIRSAHYSLAAANILISVLLGIFIMYLLVRQIPVHE